MINTIFRLVLCLLVVIGYTSIQSCDLAECDDELYGALICDKSKEDAEAALKRGANLHNVLWHITKMDCKCDDTDARERCWKLLAEDLEQAVTLGVMIKSVGENGRDLVVNALDDEGKTLLRKAVDLHDDDDNIKARLKMLFTVGADMDIECGDGFSTYQYVCMREGTAADTYDTVVKQHSAGAMSEEAQALRNTQKCTNILL